MKHWRVRMVGLAAGLLFGCLATAAVAGDSASVAGRVEIGPALESAKMRFDLYSDLQREAPTSQSYSREREMANVVVYLEPLEANPDDLREFEPRSYVMEQRESTFMPHVLPIVRGSTVEFPNRDLVFHNVFSLSKASVFDLGRYAHDKSKHVLFDKAGLVKVFCHIHSDMSAVILVRPDPWFATPAANGDYLIDEVPPGEYRVIAWHERIRPVVEAVRIEPGSRTRVNFTIPLEEARREE